MKNHKPPLSPLGETRRGFIKRSAAAAAAVAASPLLRNTGNAQEAETGEEEAIVEDPGPDENDSPGERIVLGFIGHGSQGMSHLSTAVRFATENNIEVAAVCDLWGKRLEQARTEANLPEEAAFKDYRRILDRDDIDAVFISTQDHWHAKIAIEAMETGKHAYVEKPMTRYLGEAFDLYDTAKRTGMKLQVGMQSCSQPVWSQAGELVRNGEIGPPVLAQASYMRNSGTDGEWNYAIDPDLTEEAIDWKAWLGPVPDRPFSPDAYFRWRKYFPYCAGIIGDLLPHRLGALLLAAGVEEFPRRVTCLGSRHIQTDRDVSDNTQILVEFPNGLSIVALGSTVNEQGIPDVIRGHHATLSIGGGRINLNPERPYVDELDPRILNVPSIPDRIDAHHKNWFQSIREGGEPIAGPDLSTRLQTILALAEISQRLNVMCLFDPESRKITTGEGREVAPITYGSHEEV